MVQSTYLQILQSVKQRIQELDLTGIGENSIVILKVFNDRELTLTAKVPGIALFPLGPETMDATAGTVCKDDIGYPVGVIMVDSETSGDTGNADQDYNIDNKYHWRQEIRRRFFHQRLTGVDSVYTCMVEPLPIVDEVDWSQNYGSLWVSTLLLRFISRELRL